MNPAIEFHRVQKSFGSQPVLRDFSLSVEQGAFLTVIGRSGCGKTTALRLVNALIAPDGGRVLVKGRDAAQADPAALRRGIGYARSRAAQPDILLMDEPFGAVDEITRRQLQDEILRIHQERGITILFVTHDIEEALRLGTQVLVMEEGRAAQLDAPSALMARPATPFAAQLVRRSRDFSPRR